MHKYAGRHPPDVDALPVLRVDEKPAAARDAEFRPSIHAVIRPAAAALLADEFGIPIHQRADAGGVLVDRRGDQPVGENGELTAILKGDWRRVFKSEGGHRATGKADAADGFRNFGKTAEQGDEGC
jgi:hypothetical protein